MPFAATPFQQAVRHLAAKTPLPTSLDSAGLRAVDASIRRRSVFSARTALEGYLDELKRVINSVINPVQTAREGSPLTVTEGYNPATAREALRNELQRLGYKPAEGQQGTITDLSSDARLNLLVKTNTELAQGAGHFVRQNDPAVLEMFPALELVRFEDRKEPRDWEQRWRICAAVAADPKALAALERHNRMAALKSSGIWQALGDYGDDSLGNPYPPFAYQSGMWTQDVGYADALDLGLIESGSQPQPNPLDLTQLFREEAA